mmetsp:Transcript_125689/g.367195  ORF Transcript_125689/g.367195 Transcript_125689/m.367195 type:complete len:264 (+) Transcript_125689:148-939(+)
MVISSQLNEKKPPGGSSFAGQFNNAAFAAYVYPEGEQGGKGAFKTRLQKREHRELTVPPGTMHDASVEYTQFREPGRPSRLRAAYDEHARQGRAASGERSLKPSASSPAVGMTQEGWELRAGSMRMGMARRTAPAASMQNLSTVSHANLASSEAASDAQTAASMMMNTRWYPHPSVNRGSLKLTQPKALLMGVDPLLDTGHKCPFWEAESHRFATVTKLPDARPRTPTKSLRWRSLEAWENPQNHFTMKVTQTIRSTGPTSRA